MVAVPFIAVSRVLKLSVSLLIWTLTTMKLSRVNLRSRGLYLDNRFCANVGVNLEKRIVTAWFWFLIIVLVYLYPMLWRAATKSSWDRVPSLFLSKFSNILFQSLMQLNNFPNSCTSIVPVLFVSNMLIIILHASSLNMVMSPLARACPSSLASIWPLLS